MCCLIIVLFGTDGERESKSGKSILSPRLDNDDLIIPLVPLLTWSWGGAIHVPGQEYPSRAHPSPGPQLNSEFSFF